MTPYRDPLRDAAARADREAAGDVGAATDLLERWIAETPALRAEVETVYALDRCFVARAARAGCGTPSAPSGARGGEM